MCADFPRVKTRTLGVVDGVSKGTVGAVSVVCSFPTVSFVDPRHRPFLRVQEVTPKERCRRGFSMVPQGEYPLGLAPNPKETIQSLGFLVRTLAKLCVLRVPFLNLRNHFSPRAICRF